VGAFCRRPDWPAADSPNCGRRGGKPGNAGPGRSPHEHVAPVHGRVSLCVGVNVTAPSGQRCSIPQAGEPKQQPKTREPTKRDCNGLTHPLAEVVGAPRQIILKDAPKNRCRVRKSHRRLDIGSIFERTKMVYRHLSSTQGFVARPVPGRGWSKPLGVQLTIVTSSCTPRGFVR
jgi:hypothetical protein